MADLNTLLLFFLFPTQALAGCTKLETVIATDNRLVDVGDVYGLRELRHLELGQNKIQSFPDGFAHPKKLTFLALENNLISTVGNVVGFDSLTQLFLSYNKLSDFRSAGLSLVKGFQRRSGHRG